MISNGNSSPAVPSTPTLLPTVNSSNHWELACEVVIQLQCTGLQPKQDTPWRHIVNGVFASRSKGRPGETFQERREGMMELADARLIEELLASHARISRGRPGHHRRQVTPINLAPCPKVKRCRCGMCPRCQEEARWDRIFNERFADPDYYKERPARFGSSMGWLADGGRAAS